MKPPAHESDQRVRTNVPIQKQRIETKTQPPDIQRRINAGWLRLWRAVYPNTPPPTKLQSSRLKLRSWADRRPAAVQRLASFLCLWLALALLATGCVGPRPLKGGKAVTTHKPAGVIEQTLVQGENPSQASKQDQESVKVRTYTVPAGSRMEQSLNAEGGMRSAEGRKAEVRSRPGIGCHLWNKITVRGSLE